MSDLTFNYLFAELTRHISEELIRHSIDVPIHTTDDSAIFSQARSTTNGQDGGARLTDASFVDDLTTYAKPKATTAASIRGTTQKVLDIVVKWTFAYGMRPHAKKTKIMTLITGNNSRNTSEQLAREGYTHVKHHALQDPVEIVRAQVALGTMITTSTQGPEIRRRTASATASATVRFHYTRRSCTTTHSPTAGSYTTATHGTSSWTARRTCWRRST